MIYLVAGGAIIVGIILALYAVLIRGLGWRDGSQVFGIAVITTGIAIVGAFLIAKGVELQ